MLCFKNFKKIKHHILSMNFIKLKNLQLITRVSLRAEHEQWNSCWTLRLAQGRLALGALFRSYGVVVKFLNDIWKRTGRSLFFRHSFLANFVGFIVFSFTLGHNFPYPNLFFRRWLTLAHLQKPLWRSPQIKHCNGD